MASRSWIEPRSRRDVRAHRPGLHWRATAVARQQPPWQAMTGPMPGPGRHPAEVAQRPAMAVDLALQRRADNHRMLLRSAGRLYLILTPQARQRLNTPTPGFSTSRRAGGHQPWGSSPRREGKTVRSEAGRGVGAAGEIPTMGVVEAVRTAANSPSRLAHLTSIRALAWPFADRVCHAGVGLHSGL